MAAAAEMTAANARAGAGPLAAIAKRYADALFDLALEQSEVDAVAADLRALAVMAQNSDDLRRLLRSPAFSAGDQKRAVEAVASQAALGGLTQNFLRLIAKNRRLFALEPMIDAFNARLAAHRGEVRAEATAAAALSDDHQRRLRGEIEAMIGKKVALDLRIDPEILGGLVVKVGSTMIDSSLRTKLARLKSVMKKA